MSMNADDLRSVGGHLGERAADEIEGLEQELADSNKAYALLFASHSKLRDSHDELVNAAKVALQYLEAVSFNSAGSKKSRNYAEAASIVRDALKEAGAA